MMASSNGNFFRVTGHLCGEFTGLRWIPRTKACDAQLWINDWVNNGEAGDLRRYHAHYVAIVMIMDIIKQNWHRFPVWGLQSRRLSRFNIKKLILKEKKSCWVYVHTYCQVFGHNAKINALAGYIRHHRDKVQCTPATPLHTSQTNNASSMSSAFSWRIYW